MTPITDSLRRSIQMGEMAFGEVLSSHADLEIENAKLRGVLLNVCLSWDSNVNSRIEYAVIEQAQSAIGYTHEVA